MDLTGGGTNTSTITVAANGALQFDSPYTASAASSITGAGTTIFNSGTVNLTGTYNVGTNIFSGATVNLSGSYTINQVVTISAGAVNFNAGGTLTITALNMSGGTLGGTLLVPVNGPFNWSGGTINGVTVQFKGGSFAGSDFLNGGTLVNTGTLAWNDADVYDGAGSVISNALGGTINLTANSDGTFNGYGSPQTFYNAGQLNILSSPSGPAQINDAFINTGTVTVNAGTLDLPGAYSLTNGTVNFGITNLSNFGMATLSGASPLAGTLSAAFNGGFLPAINNSWQIINDSSQMGTFSQTNLPPVAVWQVTTNPTSLTITVLKLVPQLTWTNPASIVYGSALAAPSSMPRPNGTAQRCPVRSPTILHSAPSCHRDPTRRFPCFRSIRHN